MYTPTLTQRKLHDEIDTLKDNDMVQTGNAMVAHSLVALGYVTAVECQANECLFPSREFLPMKGGRLSIDHIVWVAQEGSDLPDNLAITHWVCNLVRQPKRKRKLSDGRKPGSGHHKKTPKPNAPPAWDSMKTMEISCPWKCGYTGRLNSIGMHKKSCDKQDCGKRVNLSDQERTALHRCSTRSEMYELAAKMYATGDVALSAFEPEFLVSKGTLHTKIRVASRKF